MNNDHKFLEAVALYLLSRYDDLSRLTLVFPNKRSALFLKKHMQEALVRTSATPRFMPRFSTMGNFVSRFAPRPEMPRLEQLFLLYDCYRELLTKRGRDEQLRDFDKFIFWGGMILDDFDDVDRQLVNAEKLFKNLKDLKEINSDYLDDEQKRIVRQIWGETSRTAAVTEFWTHVNHVEGDSAEAKFVELWQLLGELYSLFTERLHNLGFETAGGQYRQAAGVISDMERDTLAARHYIFIGFNDLSHSELLILKRLKEADAADFFWDFDSAMLDLSMDDRLKNHLAKLKATFPMPEDFDVPLCDSLPDIEILAVPSCIAQSKSVTSILSQWYADETINAATAIDTAIVLPDENLLTPLLLSIPETIPAVNITMGLPFTATPFASMLSSIISMHLRAREIRGSLHYYYADIISLLSHPHIQVIAPEAAEDIKRFIAKNNLFNLDAEMICNKYPELAYIFSPVKGLDDVNQIGTYMTRLIDGLREALKANGRPSQGGLPEIEILDYLSRGIDELQELVGRYDITMNDSTYFALFERLMQSRRIELQGTPLRGMQVMGVLETRSLDFDNIIILSANENSFPRKSYMRTMIPNNLRVGYGMNSIDRQDGLYTYYFYRMLSRAKKVKIIYDSRTASFGAGEPSRFIAQLRHIMPAQKVTFRTLQFQSDLNTPVPIIVEKDSKVMRQLSCFLPGGNGNLSASALKDYKRCRLRFYLKYVMNLRGDDDITDYISPSVYGTIVHKVVEDVYRQYEGQLITPEIISSILDTPGYLDNMIARTVFSLYYRNARYTSPDDMPAEGAVTCSVIGLYLRKMFEIERDQCAVLPFRYIQGEMKVKTPPSWKINDGLSVNFNMSIDRVDELAPGYLRFIDYKTGSDKVEPTKLENIFKRGRHNDDATFQLLTYCLAYRDLTGNDYAIMPVVYPFRIMASTGEIPCITVDKVKIDDYRSIAKEFRAELFAMIEEIFSPDTPFDQAPDASSCTFCPFLDLCGRTPAKFNS